MKSRRKTFYGTKGDRITLLWNSEFMNIEIEKNLLEGLFRCHKINTVRRIATTLNEIADWMEKK